MNRSRLKLSTTRARLEFKPLELQHSKLELWQMKQKCVDESMTWLKKGDKP